MIAADPLARLPTTAVFVVSTLSQLAASHVLLPRETKTAELRGLRELNVVDWPIAATTTPAPDLRRRQQYNTVCGYIGGDAAFPATCSAGSHCVVDVDYQAVGCCPDGAPCTGGIFTGCVDVNSPPQTVLDPYVYTCTENQVCYRNTYEGGYYQYGCGSASHLATTVASTALDRLPLDLISVTVPLTAQPTPLSEPTTIGALRSTNSASTTAATTSSGTKSTGGSDTSSSNTGTGSAADATSIADPSAPTSTGSSKSTGPIVGGVLGGLAALVVLGMLGFWLWRRRQKQPKQYIDPSTEKDDDFRGHAYQDASAAVLIPDGADAIDAEPNQSESTNMYRQSLNGANLAIPMSPRRWSRPSDEIPLTRDSQKAQGGAAPAAEAETEAYPPRRRAGGGGGGGYLWSQNRSEPRTRNRAAWV